jgi:hypothetical protein
MDRGSGPRTTRKINLRDSLSRCAAVLWPIAHYKTKTRHCEVAVATEAISITYLVIIHDDEIASSLSPAKSGTSLLEMTVVWFAGGQIPTWQSRGGVGAGSLRFASVIEPSPKMTDALAVIEFIGQPLHMCR